MKNKQLIALLSGLIATSFAMASTVPTVDYTLTTSANLTGNYSFYDSGYYSSSKTEWLTSSFSSKTTASILGTFQDVSGNWFQRTSFSAVNTYDYLAQDYQESGRNVSLYFNVTGDQWVDLSFTTSTPMSYSVDAWGTYGSKLSPRGFPQTVSPALGLIVDGAEVLSASYSHGGGNWYGVGTGQVDSTFEVVAEATDGGTITSLYVQLYSHEYIGSQYIGQANYDGGTYIRDVAISAPVPEPETYAMLLAGLGLIGTVARRRRATK